IGMKVDLDRLVVTAEKGYEGGKSSATRQLLQSALKLRALETVTAKDPAAPRLAKKNLRNVGPSNPLTETLRAKPPPPFAKQLLENADSKRAYELFKKGLEDFPDSITAAEWAFVEAVEPDAAPKVMAAAATNQMDQIYAQLGPILKPESLDA